LAAGGSVLFAAGLGGCTPGYIKATDLEHRDQGPTACAKTCDDLQMRMVAMVLVGDALPGCVCQVLDAPPPMLVPVPVAPSAPAPSSAVPMGTNPVHAEAAAASAGSYVVIAAAAAAQQQQRQQQQLQQQQRVK
jgi:hypothetical protein